MLSKGAGVNILRLQAVKDKTGLPTSTLYWKISRNIFPKPVKLGERSVGWVESEINQWLSDKVSLRESR